MLQHGECRREQLDMCGLDGSSYLVGDKVCRFKMLPPRTYAQD